MREPLNTSLMHLKYLKFYDLKQLITFMQWLGLNTKPLASPMQILNTRFFSQLPDPHLQHEYPNPFKLEKLCICD